MASAMMTFSIQSGSNGNAIYVECDGVRLLFDAGVSARVIRDRMTGCGRNVRDLTALILSHDHADHVRGAGALNRMFGTPIYLTPGTHRAASTALGRVSHVSYFFAGQTLEFAGGQVRVQTIPTPHDAADGVIFVVEGAGKRLGIFTDVGHPFGALRDALGSVDAAYLESNYDPDMLETGNYPPELKARIRGAGGHISNDEAAAMLAAVPRRHAWIALAHLSAQNNRPEIALRAHRKQLGETFPLLVAGRAGPSPVMRL